jgi:hypothetical protein
VVPVQATDGEQAIGDTQHPNQALTLRHNTTPCGRRRQTQEMVDCRIGSVSQGRIRSLSNSNSQPTAFLRRIQQALGVSRPTCHQRAAPRHSRTTTLPLGDI